MSDSPDTPLTATAYLSKHDHRRGAIPTAAGALPLPRRRRKGMLDLSAWDAAVAEQNASNGTASNSDKPNILQLIANKATRAETDAETPAPEQIAANPEPGQTPQLPPKPHDPDEDEVVSLETGAPRPPVSSGALLEDSQIRQNRNPEVNIPAATPEGIAAAKAALKAEEDAAAAAENSSAPADDKIPPPPARKQATKQAPTRTPK